MCGNQVNVFFYVKSICLLFFCQFVYIFLRQIAEFHEEDMIENAISKHDFELTDGGPSQSRNWPENNYFASSTDRPVYSSYSNYKREPYRANTPKSRFSPSPKNYNKERSRVRLDLSVLQHCNTMALRH